MASTATLLGGDEARVEPSPAPSAPATAGRRSPARRLVAAGAPVLLLCGGVLDSPVLVLLAVLMTTWVLLTRRMAGDVAVPASALALLMAAIVAGVGADVVAVDLLGQPTLLLLAYALYCTAVAVRPGEQVYTAALPAPFGLAALLAYLPAVLTAGVALRQAFDERLAASWVLLGTDVGRHMMYVQSLQDLGRLDYDENGYPRGFHMLVALMSVPGRALDDPGSALVYDLRLVAACSVLALALLVMTASCFVLRSAPAWRCGRRTAVLAAASAGTGLLWLSSFVKAFLIQAAAPSLLALVVLWMLPLTALVLRESRYRMLALLLVAAVSVMLLAHLWQPLAVAPAAAALACLAMRVAARRRLVAEVFPGRGGALLLLGVALAAAVVALVPVLAVQATEGGIAVAAIPGDAPAPPLALLLASVILIAALAALGRHQAHRVILVAEALVLVLICAFMLRVNGQGWDLEQYYPQKVSWFLVVLMFPAVVLLTSMAAALAVSLAGRGLDRFGAAARVLRVTTAATCFALLFAYVLPFFVVELPAVTSAAQVQPGTEDVVRRLDLALEHAEAHGEAVPVPVSIGSRPMPDRVATPIVSMLLAFQSGQPTNQGYPQSVCDDVALVAGDRPAVVVTALEAAYLSKLMRNRGCGDTPIVQVPGGGADPLFLPKE